MKGMVPTLSYLIHDTIQIPYYSNIRDESYYQNWYHHFQIILLEK